MIISHKYKYVFLELPYTGTRSVSKELCIYYGGEPILSKHSNYYEFIRRATQSERNYFLFSAIRNPLDEAVSRYFKYKNAGLIYDFPPMRPGVLGKLTFRNKTKRINFIRDNNASFTSYFLKFYKFPYDNWSSVSHDKCNFVMRFERLQEDFSEVLGLIGIKQVQLLPVRAKTKGRHRDFLSYYTPETLARAQRVFGPFMSKWNYDVPWSNDSTFKKRCANIAYELFAIGRYFYWKYIRYWMF